MALAPALLFAQRAPSVANLRMMIVPAWTAPDSVLDSLAILATNRLRNRSEARDVTALSWRIVDRMVDNGSLVKPTPQWSNSDLFELGKTAGGAVVLVIRRDTGSRLTVLPTLVRDREQMAWRPIRAANLLATADSIVARIGADSTIRRLRAAALQCSPIARGLLSVDQSAAFIGDTLAELRPVGGNARGASVIRAVIDSTGRVDLSTLVVLQLSGQATLDQITSAARRWRFSPAIRGRCAVRQRLDLRLTR